MSVQPRQDEADLVRRFRRLDPEVIEIVQRLIDIKFERAKTLMVHALRDSMPALQGRAQALDDLRKVFSREGE